MSVEGPALYLVRIPRVNIGAYMCIASNGIPPSVSKRFMLRVQCRLIFLEPVQVSIH